MADSSFSAFPPGTLRFLRGLRKDNSRAWFEEHRSEYDQFYVGAGRQFVEAVAPRLKKLSRELVAEPKINGSIFRINRDVRFSKDKRPYKRPSGLFIPGRRKRGSSSALFLRVSPDGVFIGAGHHSCKYLQKAFRTAVADVRRGKELAAVARKIRKAGYTLEGQHYKRMPKNFADDGPAAEFLLHDGLYIVVEHKPAFAQNDDLIDECVRHWKAAMPLHRWLIDHVRA